MFWNKNSKANQNRGVLLILFYKYWKKNTYSVRTAKLNNNEMKIKPPEKLFFAWFVIDFIAVLSNDTALVCRNETRHSCFYFNICRHFIL